MSTKMLEPLKKDFRDFRVIKELDSFVKKSGFQCMSTTGNVILHGGLFLWVEIFMKSWKRPQNSISWF